MELGPLEGGYLELLNSNADPLHLYHFYDHVDLAGEEEIDHHAWRGRGPDGILGTSCCLG